MMVTKAHILDEIELTAEANGGQALGRLRFYAETGIKETDWSGKYWVRWSDALREAGYAPNQFQLAYDERFLLKELASFVRELGHFPVIAELKLRADEGRGVGCRAASVWMESGEASLSGPLPEAWTDQLGARILLGPPRGATLRRPALVDGLRRTLSMSKDQRKSPS
jgi:hypothetical protein